MARSAPGDRIGRTTRALTIVLGPRARRSRVAAWLAGRPCPNLAAAPGPTIPEAAAPSARI